MLIFRGVFSVAFAVSCREGSCLDQQFKAWSFASLGTSFSASWTD